jgi:hypothetical protein
MRALPRAGAVIVGVCLAEAGITPVRDAKASVSIAVSWDALLGASTAAAIVSPAESHAVWEGGRIYTYTRVHVDRSIAGDLSTGSDTWIRTRGGTVGHVGQQVEGEASLAVGSSLVFLRPAATSSSSYEVTARAQGQFPVTAADDPSAPAHVAPSRGCGMLVPRAIPTPQLPAKLASEVLANRTVDDAAGAIAAAWSSAHAR